MKVDCFFFFHIVKPIIGSFLPGVEALTSTPRDTRRTSLRMPWSRSSCSRTPRLPSPCPPWPGSRRTAPPSTRSFLVSFLSGNISWSLQSTLLIKHHSAGHCGGVLGHVEGVGAFLSECVRDPGESVAVRPSGVAPQAQDPEREGSPPEEQAREAVQPDPRCRRRRPPRSHVPVAPFSRRSVGSPEQILFQRIVIMIWVGGVI